MDYIPEYDYGTQSLAYILSQRKWPLYGLGICALCFGLYFGIWISGSVQDPSVPAKPSPAEFDASLNWQEWIMGLNSLRKKVASRARGQVLEVSIGTGRNLDYYEWKLDGGGNLSKESVEAGPPKTIQSPRPHFFPGLKNPGIFTFTGVDIDADMLSIALKRLPKLRAELEERVRIFKGDALGALPPPPIPSHPPPADKYDTIVQTFGLCSVDDPVGLVENLAKMVKPETGMIVLLEHGRGWRAINFFLDRNPEARHARYGCWWNRDIEAIIKESQNRVPELQVRTLERPYVLQFGTVVYAELVVSKSPLKPRKN